MSGERNLDVLLRSLNPILDDQEYTFATGSESAVASVARPIGVFREEEGTSVICSRSEAERLRLKHSGSFRRITLGVHSSLDAVGLTARVAQALADQGISCNVVAGFFHDHLFVPVVRAEDAMAALRRLGATPS